MELHRDLLSVPHGKCWSFWHAPGEWEGRVDLHVVGYQGQTMLHYTMSSLQNIKGKPSPAGTSQPGESGCSQLGENPMRSGREQLGETLRKVGALVQGPCPSHCATGTKLVGCHGAGGETPALSHFTSLWGLAAGLTGASQSQLGKALGTGLPQRSCHPQRMPGGHCCPAVFLHFPRPRWH